MLETEKNYEKILDSEDDLIKLFKEIPERNIGFAFTGKPFPIVVHVMRQGDKATVRELNYDVLKSE